MDAGLYLPTLFVFNHRDIWYLEANYFSNIFVISLTEQNDDILFVLGDANKLHRYLIDVRCDYNAAVCQTVDLIQHQILFSCTPLFNEDSYISFIEE